MKIKAYIENIFAQAIQLEQNSRSKNLICCNGDQIIIVNSDSTIMVHFKIKEKLFQDSIGFYANDYESSQFEEVNGKIVFVSGNEDWERRKNCKMPETSFEDLSSLYKKMKKDTKKVNKITVSNSIREVLDEGLSHIELIFKDGDFEILQRDIFTGTVIHVKRKGSKGLFDVHKDSITKNTGAIGLRTLDFLGLFTFVNKIDFYVFDNGYAFFKGDKLNMSGYISTCLYDDMGSINYLKDGK